jgi:hypothetical protein
MAHAPVINNVPIAIIYTRSSTDRTNHAPATNAKPNPVTTSAMLGKPGRIREMILLRTRAKPSVTLAFGIS